MTKTMRVFAAAEDFACFVSQSQVDSVFGMKYVSNTPRVGELPRILAMVKRVGPRLPPPSHLLTGYRLGGGEKVAGARRMLVLWNSWLQTCSCDTWTRNKKLCCTNMDAAHACTTEIDATHILAYLMRFARAHAQAVRYAGVCAA